MSGARSPRKMLIKFGTFSVLFITCIVCDDSTCVDITKHSYFKIA